MRPMRLEESARRQEERPPIRRVVSGDDCPEGGCESRLRPAIQEDQRDGINIWRTRSSLGNDVRRCLPGATGLGVQHYLMFEPEAKALARERETGAYTSAYRLQL